MEQLCPHCFWVDIREAGRCICNYEPPLPPEIPGVKAALKRKNKARSEKDTRLLECEVQRLKRCNEILEEFRRWREKLNAMMDQAMAEIESSGVSYHPCYGCAMWGKWNKS